MRSRHWIAALSSVGLLAGCVTTESGNFCDIARPMYMRNAAVLDWLAENDVTLLRDIVAHNEKTARCP